MKKFFLFTERGLTDRFFCGNIYEALPDDKIRYHGCPMTFKECAEQELCKAFKSRKEANDFSRAEAEAMKDSDNYAREAMEAEERYGYEGVDY